MLGTLLSPQAHRSLILQSSMLKDDRVQQKQHRSAFTLDPDEEAALLDF